MASLTDVSAPVVEPIDTSWMQQARSRLDRLTKPLGSLGYLETLAIQLVGISRTLSPALERSVIVTMAADHGVAQEGISAYPQAVTAQMVANFLRGTAAINVLARHIGARIVVVDMGVAEAVAAHEKLLSRKIRNGTCNMSCGAAMTREEVSRAVQTGIDIVAEQLTQGMDVIATGEMGIGNTTAASAITAVMTRHPVERVTGRGTGVDDTHYTRKLAVIRRALEVNRPDPQDPIDVLSKVGGFEIAGLVGVILASAQARRPVVVDGFITGAAALIAAAFDSHVTDYLIASHRSQEPGHRLMLEHLRLRPLLDLDMRLGEGTGAALAIPILQAAGKLLMEMATFDEAGVAERLS